MKYRLLKDIVIQAGTELDVIDGWELEFIDGNAEAVIALTNDVTGYFIIGGVDEIPELVEMVEEK